MISLLSHLLPRRRRGKGALHCGAHCIPLPSRLGTADLLVFLSFLLCCCCVVLTAAATHDVPLRSLPGYIKKSQKLNVIFASCSACLSVSRPVLSGLTTEPPVASRR